MKKLFYLLSSFVFAFSCVQAQPVTLTTVGTGYGPSAAWANGYIAFAVNNTNPYAIKITDVSTWYDLTNNGGIFTLYATATQLTGQPNITAAGGWSQVAASAPITAATAGITPVLTGQNIVIPPNTTHRFAFTVSVGSIYYAGGSAAGTPSPFSGGGVDFITFLNNVTTGGDFPNATPNFFNPRAFVGSITFDKAVNTKPCVGVTDAGKVIASDTALCPNLGYDYILMNNTHSRNDTDTNGYTWYWETSVDDVVWTFLPGSVDKDTITGIFTDDVWYRMRIICTTGPDSVMTNTVHIRQKDAEKCYCYSQSAGGDADSSDIGAVYVNKFGADVGGPHLLNPLSLYRRTDYTDLNPIELYIDSSYQFEIKHIMKGNFHRNAKVTIFMDFNNNQQYDLDHEKVFSGLTGPTSFVLTPVITIPDSVIEKFPTGMRIILNDDIGPSAASDSACGGYISGETEDFMVLFQRAFPTGVNSASLLSGLTLYPNPADGRVNVTFNAPKAVNNVTLSVTTITGVQVWQQSYEDVKGKFEEQLNLGNQPKGVYFIQLSADGQKTTHRVVVQ